MSNKNKEFSIVIRFIPLNKMKKEEYEFLADEFDFQPAITTDNGGTIFNCDQERIIMRPEEEVISEFSFPRSGILVYKDTTGKLYQLGTSDIPARISIVPYLNSAQIVIKCSMLQSPLV